MSERVTVIEIQVGPDRFMVDADFAHQLADFAHQLPDELADAKQCIEQLEEENMTLRQKIGVMDNEALLANDIWETDRSEKWHLTQKIEKRDRELANAKKRIEELEHIIVEVIRIVDPKS